MTTVPAVLGHGSGPPTARIMLVGEVWGPEEERTREPFSGESGKEFNRCLHDAGVMRSECWVTNVVNARPPWQRIEAWIPRKKSDRKPEHTAGLHGKLVHPIVRQGYEALLREIEMVKPNLIVAAGATALWALTGKEAITHWRGSLLAGLRGEKVLAILHPAAVMQQWEVRPILVNDLRRIRGLAADPMVTLPAWNLRIDPSFAEVCSTLDSLITRVEAGPELWLDWDLETAGGHIRCSGISWSAADAMCIPFMRQDATGRWLPDGNWSAEAEAAIVWRKYRLMTHPNCWVRGQNLLHDAQYSWRHWNFVPNIKQDTMLTWHTLFPGMKKSLDFQASMLCQQYTQWKPERTQQKDGG